MVKVTFNKNVVKKMSLIDFKKEFSHLSEHVDLDEEYSRLNPSTKKVDEVVETLTPPKFKTESKPDKSK